MAAAVIWARLTESFWLNCQLFGLTLLFAIPLVGLILALVWSFGGTDNPARKRLARSYLIRTLVVIAVVALFVLVVSLVFSAVLHSQLAYSYYYMR